MIHFWLQEVCNSGYCRVGFTNLGLQKCTKTSTELLILCWNIRVKKQPMTFFFICFASCIQKESRQFYFIASWWSPTGLFKGTDTRIYPLLPSHSRRNHRYFLITVAFLFSKWHYEECSFHKSVYIFTIIYFLLMKSKPKQLKEPPRFLCKI